MNQCYGKGTNSGTVDDLRSALTLATDEELRDLTELLFQPKFNPLDYVTMPRPVQVQGYDRTRQIEVIEQRFRFLAAPVEDGEGDSGDGDGVGVSIKPQ